MIIDWMNALIGNPIADAARSGMMLKSNGLPPQAPGWLREREARLLFADAYSKEFCKLSEIRVDEIEAWMPITYAVRTTETSGEELGEILQLLRSSALLNGIAK